MDEFNKPIIPPGRIDQERVYMPPVEKIKEEHQEEEKRLAEEKKNKSIVYATVLFSIKKLINIFTPGKSNDSSASEIKIISVLKRMKIILEKLKMKDLSRQIPYSQEFSELWNQLSEYQQLVISSKQRNFLNMASINKLIESIKNYPPLEDHSLGYYLTEHAGEDWLPFPFMELIKKLHEEYQNQGKQSHLHQWTSLIEDVIETQVE